jgi:hypothetical protein
MDLNMTHAQRGQNDTTLGMNPLTLIAVIVGVWLVVLVAMLYAQHRCWKSVSPKKPKGAVVQPSSPDDNMELQNINSPQHPEPCNDDYDDDNEDESESVDDKQKLLRPRSSEDRDDLLDTKPAGEKDN